jgi:hypothetical protein
VAVQIFTRLLSPPGFYSVVAEPDGRIVASNVLDERSTIAAARCSMQSNKRAQTVVEHNDRVTGYATPIRWFEHAVGETNEELKALIGASPGYPEPGFPLLTLNTALFRWCLEQGLGVVQAMTLMSIGFYNEPADICLPSVLY